MYDGFLKVYDDLKNQNRSNVHPSAQSTWHMIPNDLLCV